MSIFGPLDNLLRENAQLQADLAAAREREQRLMTRLRCAERNTLYQDTDLDWCRICDQTAPPGEAIDHAPDCPFAAAAPAAEAREPRMCRCGRPLINPGEKDPWCEGCTMSAATCDCIEIPHARGSK